MIAVDTGPWRSRGYLPHMDRPGVVQSLTFRLADAVPEPVVETWKRELAWHNSVSAANPRQAELRRRIAKYEDAGHGTCHLREARVAALTEEALLHFDGVRYLLIAWCVMPNHVHAVVETQSGFSLARIVHSWKSWTAHGANRLLGRNGPFWMREYHDRFIRDERHLAAAIHYVEGNPVSAGLVDRADAWGRSSARERLSWERRRPAGIA